MIGYRFDYHSLRARKARLAKRMNSGWLNVIAGAGFVLSVGGLYLALFYNDLGWVAVGLSVYPFMVVEWFKGELKNLAIDAKDRTLAGWCDANVLGYLPENPSPFDVAVAIEKSRADNFMKYRFGIDASFIKNIASHESSDYSKFWDSVVEVMHDTSSEVASADVLIAALIKSNLNASSLISSMLIDINDVYAGIRWHQHLERLITESGKHYKNGGIARDWSFGWVPKLSRYGQNISQLNSFALPTIDLDSRERAVLQIAKHLGANGKKNVALVGPAGSGKTAILRDFGSRLMKNSGAVGKSLLYHQLFLLDAAVLIAESQKKGDVERLFIEILNEAYNAKNIIIGLDNAHLFFEDGIGSIDVANLLKPAIEAGSLPMIMVFNDKKFTKLSSRHSELVSLLNRVNVKPSDENESMVIMQDAVISLEYNKKVVYMYQALREAYKAGVRYVNDSTMPAQAVGVLELAASYSSKGVVTAQSIHDAVEEKYGIKMGVAESFDEKGALLNLKDRLGERVVGQDRAIKALSDSLKRAGAGVRSTDRPIGTFMFVGPTGSGKTELAKALAAIYFGGEDKLVRVDMNEYVTSRDAIRLISSAGENTISLTAQINRQPFSVVLLDEIEKAHPKVLAILLQLLDEGVLTDDKNHKVSFKDSIIIATSNAGSDRIREYIDRGMDVQKNQKQFIDELIRSKTFSSEFMNRFDEIVMFEPLDKFSLKKVIGLITDSINQTLANQKIKISMSEPVVDYLIENGNDAAFGARPMRRIVQKLIENKIANDVLSGKIKPGDVVKIGIEDIKK